jgi:hypothetical protein
VKQREREREREEETEKVKRYYLFVNLECCSKFSVTMSTTNNKWEERERENKSFITKPVFFPIKARTVSAFELQIPFEWLLGALPAR